MTKNLKIGFVSLGCSKNQIDSEIMLNYLNDEGFELTSQEEKADIIIINTCGFIGDAKQESYEIIEDLAKLKQTAHLKKIIVAGCLAQRYKEKIIEKYPFVDAVMGVGSIHQIVKVVKQCFEKDKVCCFEDNKNSSISGTRFLLNEPYSAYVRISEGCNNRCTYCTIPSIRGNYRSRTKEDILQEIKKIEKSGLKELNLIAQDTSIYGIDIYGKYALPELLQLITAETNIPWIRLFYCYPDKITDELISEIKNNPKVLHYIDMPIQHINDSVLKRMNRQGNRKTIEKVISKLRTEIPDIVIRTTAIVGFPGETDEEFNELADFVDEIKFNRFGAFKYSREEGTPAYKLPDQIDEDEKINRYEEIMSIQQNVSLEYQQNFVGTIQKVLCEGFDDEVNKYVGRNYANAPDIDGLVYFSSKENIQLGDFVNVKIKKADEYDLYGSQVK